jgi:hypothetical protein
LSTNRRSRASSSGLAHHGEGSQDKGSSGAVSLRQSALDVRVIVVPANIGVLSDPFANVNYNPGRIASSGSGGGGAGKGGGSQQGSGSGSGSAGAQSSLNARLSEIINANTLTGVVVGTVSLAVANSVASSTASSSAGMGNAFQMIGHAQCESVVALNLSPWMLCLRT